MGCAIIVTSFYILFRWMAGNPGGVIEIRNFSCIDAEMQSDLLFISLAIFGAKLFDISLDLLALESRAV
jgi:hypothetical protein